MRMDQLADAGKLAARLMDAEADLQNAKDGAHLTLRIKYPYPATAAWCVIDEVNESASGEAGLLAGKIRALVVEHYRARCNFLRAQLTALGVDP